MKAAVIQMVILAHPEMGSISDLDPRESGSINVWRKLRSTRTADVIYCCLETCMCKCVVNLAVAETTTIIVKVIVSGASGIGSEHWNRVGLTSES